LRLLPYVLTLALGLALPAAAQGARGSMAEAEAMTHAAAAHLEAVGPEAAFADFGNLDDKRWHDRDLYVVVIDHDAVVMVHGVRPSLNNRPTRSVRDVDGKPFPEEMLALEAPGWVRYKWMNPISETVEPKASYVVRSGDYRVLVGAYDQ
jgi:signal transduction histidine kinase